MADDVFNRIASEDDEPEQEEVTPTPAATGAPTAPTVQPKEPDWKALGPRNVLLNKNYYGLSREAKKYVWGKMSENFSKASPEDQDATLDAPYEHWNNHFNPPWYKKAGEFIEKAVLPASIPGLQDVRNWLQEPEASKELPAPPPQIQGLPREIDPNTATDEQKKAHGDEVNEFLKKATPEQKLAYLKRPRQPIVSTPLTPPLSKTGDYGQSLSDKQEVVSTAENTIKSKADSIKKWQDESEAALKTARAQLGIEPPPGSSQDQVDQYNKRASEFNNKLQEYIKLYTQRSSELRGLVENTESIARETNEQFRSQNKSETERQKWWETYGGPVFGHLLANPDQPLANLGAAWDWAKTNPIIANSWGINKLSPEAKGAIGGVLDQVSALTSLKNMGILGALTVMPEIAVPAALGAAGKALMPLAQMVVSGYFSVDMLTGAIKQTPDAIKDLKEGRTEDGIRKLTSALGSAVLGVMSGKHASESGSGAKAVYSTYKQIESQMKEYEKHTPISTKDVGKGIQRVKMMQKGTLERPPAPGMEPAPAVKPGEPAIKSVEPEVTHTAPAEGQPPPVAGTPAGGTLDKTVPATEPESKPPDQAEELMRGKWDTQLNDQGKVEANLRAKQISDTGGVNRVISSDLGRASDTAERIADMSGAEVEKTPALQPLALGESEGKPTYFSSGRFDKEGKPISNIDDMHNRMRNAPDEPMPGVGQHSGEKGESLNQFRERTLGYIQKLMIDWTKDPSQRWAVVTHYRVIKAMQAWAAKGFDGTRAIDTEEMFRKDGEPASVYLLKPNPTGWSFELYPIGEIEEGEPGILFVRHGTTDANLGIDGGVKPEEAKPTESQKVNEQEHASRSIVDIGELNKQAGSEGELQNAGLQEQPGAASEGQEGGRASGQPVSDIAERPSFEASTQTIPQTGGGSRPGLERPVSKGIEKPPTATHRLAQALGIGPRVAEPLKPGQTEQGKRAAQWLDNNPKMIVRGKNYSVIGDSDIFTYAYRRAVANNPIIKNLISVIAPHFESIQNALAKADSTVDSPEKSNAHNADLAGIFLDVNRFGANWPGTELYGEGGHNQIYINPLNSLRSAFNLIKDGLYTEDQLPTALARQMTVTITHELTHQLNWTYDKVKGFIHNEEFEKDLNDAIDQAMPMIDDLHKELEDLFSRNDGQLIKNLIPEFSKWEKSIILNYRTLDAGQIPKTDIPGKFSPTHEEEAPQSVGQVLEAAPEAKRDYLDKYLRSERNNLDRLNQIAEDNPEIKKTETYKKVLSNIDRLEQATKPTFEEDVKSVEVMDRLGDAIARRNVEKDGRIYQNGKEVYPTDEVLSQVRNYANGRIAESQSIIDKMLEIKAFGKNTDTQAVRAELAGDARARTADEAISQYRARMKDTRQYLTDIESANRVYNDQKSRESSAISPEDRGGKEWGTRNQYYYDSPYKKQLDQIKEKYDRGESGTDKDYEIEVKHENWMMNQVLKDKPAYIVNPPDVSNEDAIAFADKHGLVVGKVPGDMGEENVVVAKDAAALKRVVDAVGPNWPKTDEGHRELGLALGYQDLGDKARPVFEEAESEDHPIPGVVLLDQYGRPIGRITPKEKNVQSMWIPSARPIVGAGTPPPSRDSADDIIRGIMDPDIENRARKDLEFAFRTFVYGTREAPVAAANQLSSKMASLVPEKLDQQALYFYREFQKRPGELEEIINGSHYYYNQLEAYIRKNHPNLTDDEVATKRQEAIQKISSIKPILERAAELIKGPVDGMSDTERDGIHKVQLASDVMTQYFTNRLEEGKRLGFLDSNITPEEYITHYLTFNTDSLVEGKPEMGVGTGSALGTEFDKAKRREIKDMAKAVIFSGETGAYPATVNAIDAMTLYARGFSSVRTSRIVTDLLERNGALQWTHARDADRIPSWIPYNKDESSPLWKNNEGKAAYGPRILVDAVRPFVDKNYLDQIAGTKKLAAYQRYLKTVELGLSAFHMKALTLSGMASMGPIRAQRAFIQDMESMDFREKEVKYIEHGLTTPIQGKTMEAYKNLDRLDLGPPPGSIRKTAEWVDKNVSKVTDSVAKVTFDIVQRKFKVYDMALKEAKWLANNPEHTEAEYGAAMRGFAKQVNSTYGGLNWETMGINKATIGASRLIFLAPDWTFSNLASAKYAFEGGTAGSAARMFWLRSMLIGTALTQGFSFMLTGKPSKEFTSVYLGNDAMGREKYANTFFAGAPGDITKLGGNIYDFGLIGGAFQSIAGKVAPVARTSIQLLTNRNWMGQQITKKELGPIANTLRSAYHIASQLGPVPFSVADPISMWATGEGKYDLPEYLLAGLLAARTRHVVPGGYKIKGKGKRARLAPEPVTTEAPFLEKVMKGKSNLTKKEIRERALENPPELESPPTQ